MMVALAPQSAASSAEQLEKNPAAEDESKDTKYVSRRSKGERGTVSTISYEEESKEDDEIGASVDELASLLDKMGGDKTQWKNRTKNLVETISNEISRILEYDEAQQDEDQEEQNDQAEEEEEQGQVEEHPDQDEQEQEEGDISSKIDQSELESLLSYFEDGGSTKGSPAEFLDTKTKAALTPYDVWKRSRGPKDDTPPARKLTKSEVNKLVERLGQYQKTKELHIMQKQHVILREQLENLPFRPKICRRSRQLAKVKPLQKRLSAVIAHKRQRIDEHRKQAAEAEAIECTPQAPYKKLAWTPRVSNDFLLAYRKEDAAEAAAELTFHPMINKRSSKIVEQASRHGMRRSLVENTSLARKKVHYKAPVYAYHPTINERSKSLRRDTKESVHDRLHKTGLKGKQAKFENQLPQREEIERQENSDPSATTTATNENIVNFDPAKHSFLLKRVSFT